MTKWAYSTFKDKERETALHCCYGIITTFEYARDRN